MPSAIPQIAIIATLVFSAGGSAFGQRPAKTELANEAERIAPLKGKPTVAIMLVVTTEITDVGLEESVLKARIREYLQANNIPSATGFEKPTGLLSVTVLGKHIFQREDGIAGSVEPGLVFYLRLEYTEWVQQMRMPKQETVAPLWTTDDIFQVGEVMQASDGRKGTARGAVLSCVMAKAKDFAMDYLRANPDLVKH